MPKRVIVIRSKPAAHCGRTLNVLRMVQEAGFEARALCWDRSRTRPSTEDLRGAPVRNSHVPGRYSSKVLLAMVPVWWIRELFYLLVHGAECYYAVDLDTGAPALAATVLRKLARRRTCLVYDIADFYTAKAVALPLVLRRPLDALERFIAGQADVVVMPDAARTYLLGSTRPRRVIILPNTPYDLVDPNWKKLDREEFVLFYAGSLAPHRGIRKLVRVTEELEKVRVVIAGQTKDPERLALFERARHVEYLGLISRAEVVRRTFEADAVYSYYDPVLEINRTANSTKLYEAMMCGTPVVCNSEPPSTRVVVETGCGVCLPYDDEEGLRRTILEWRDNREAAREMGRRGRRAFEERFNWPANAQPLVEFLRERLDEQADPPPAADGTRDGSCAG